MTLQSNYLYVPSFLESELDAAETHQLSTLAAHDIAKRTRSGGIFVFGCLLLGSSISDFPEQSPIIHSVILVMALLAGVIRSFIARKVPSSKQSLIKWQWLYSSVILSSAITWFSFFAMHLSMHSFEQSTLILLIATAGYLGTLTSTMFMWQALTLVYIGIVITPILMTLFLVDINTGLILLMGFIIYLFFLLLQVYGLNKQYWQSSKAHILLERQTEELRKAKEEAEQAVQVKTQFLSSMSHELRTPMNAVIGFSELLETDLNSPLTVDQKESVGVIKASARHLLHLINDILDLVQVDSGNVKLDIKPIQIDEVLDEVILISQQKAALKNVEIKKTVQAEQGFRILADSQRFRQIMLNLVSNAIKYNHDNGEVIISAYREHTDIIISVSDTGIGIEKSKFNQVFEPFDRLGMERTAIPGTGIGLSICKDLVERMGGEIGMEAVENETGMNFWLRFKGL